MTTVTTPRDFTVLLPPGWMRISLDGREGARAAALAAQKTGGLADPQRQQVREKLTKIIRGSLRDARAGGGIDVLLSLAERDGMPLAASCLISYLDRETRVALDRMAAEMSDDTGDATLVEIPSGPAVRRRYLEMCMTNLDYFLPVPGRTGLLVLAFATPIEPLADAFVVLFDAIAESLRWQR